MPSISPNKPYRIGRSKTGLGLFATRTIKKGEQIIRYFGPMLDSRNKKHQGIDNKYLFELNGRWTIDGSVRRNIARYINHACKPNAESDVNPRKRTVMIRAIKTIEPGVEINYDYGKDYFKSFLAPIGCKCDACEAKRKKRRAEERAERARVKTRADKRAAKSSAAGTRTAASKASAPRKAGAKKAAPKKAGPEKRASKQPTKAAVPKKASARKAARGTKAAKALAPAKRGSAAKVRR
jgi:hypothetical protein